MRRVTPEANRQILATLVLLASHLPRFRSSKPEAAESPPAGVPLSATTTMLPAAQKSRRRPRSASLIAVAALTALVIGGAAGYGGATLARRSEAPASTTASPSALPGVTRTLVAPAPPSANTVEVAKRVLPATVMIQAGRGTGSGFLIDRDGRIVTNNHVVSDATGGSRIRVILSDGRRLNAVLVGHSPSYDIAVIRVSGVASLRLQPNPGRRAGDRRRLAARAARYRHAGHYLGSESSGDGLRRRSRGLADRVYQCHPDRRLY